MNEPTGVPAFDLPRATALLDAIADGADTARENRQSFEVSPNVTAELRSISRRLLAGEQDRERLDAIERSEIELQCMGTTVPYFNAWSRSAISSRQPRWIFCPLCAPLVRERHNMASETRRKKRSREWGYSPVEGGIANMPGFVASLRLLVEREQYALSDIAAMFSVSCERIRQLCEREGIVHPTQCRGVFAYRAWNDAENCFRPVRRSGLVDAQRRARAAVNRAAKRAEMSASCDEFVARVRALVARVGPSPTWGQIHKAVFGREAPSAGSACPLVLAAWRSGDRTTREKSASFRAATGTIPRHRGFRGRLSAQESSA